MNETIRELFSGKLSNRYNIYESEFTDEMYSAVNELKETFTDKQKELYKSYKTACAKHENEAVYMGFESGFGLACRIIFEGLK